jgi:TraG P-loop domain
MKFPVLSATGNKLVSLKGETSYCFELFPPDFEQMNIDSVTQFLGQIKKEIINLPVNFFYKIYRMHGHFYLATPENCSPLSQLKASPLIDPLFKIFPYEKFYSNVEFFEDYFKFNGEYFRFLEVVELPEKLSPNGLASFGDMGVFFRRVPKEKAKLKLNTQRKLHFSGIFEALKNVLSHKAFNQSEKLLEELISGEECLFEIKIRFLLRSIEMSSLNDATTKGVELINLMGGKAIIPGRSHAYYFNEFLPGVTPVKWGTLTTSAKVLSYALPMGGDSAMDSGIKFKSVSNEVVLLNLFHQTNPNYNMLITGSSGQGKSMLAAKILMEEVLKGKKAVILDMGGSFKKLTRYLGGNEITTTINPMQFGEPLFLREFILSNKSAVGAKEIAPLAELNQAILLKKIKETLKARPDIKFWDLIYSINEVIPNTELFFEEIKEFLGDLNLPDNAITYVDVSLYPIKFQPPLILFLIQYFKKLTGEKIFLMDECWHLLERHADFVANCFRTFRKEKASGLAITQGISDFLSIPLGEAIWLNSHFKVLFRQEITRSNPLSEFEDKKLQSIYSSKGNYSEFLVLADHLKKTMRFFPSELEYELFTTDKDDLNDQKKYLDSTEHLFGFKRSIENFTRLKYGKSLRGEQ